MCMENIVGEFVLLLLSFIVELLKSSSKIRLWFPKLLQSAKYLFQSQNV